MSSLASCIYVGEVTHRRVSPVKHLLRYRVYDFFVDVDELADLGLRFFSYNRFNLFSLNDRCFGAGDGTAIREHVWGLVEKTAQAQYVERIFMLCYPAVLGRVFNPLTTYYCYDADEQLCLMIYEVSNTFGERHSYVIPMVEGVQQRHDKKFYVSPFNPVEGNYDFSVVAPADVLSLGVALRVNGQPVMQAWFKGEKRPLTDAALLRSFFSLPMQPLKVIAGIHWEALKLWMKGLRVAARPVQTKPNVSFAEDKISNVEGL